MNADLKRVRETTQEDGSSPTKRRAMSLSNSSAPESEGDSHVGDWQRVLEVKRKEAIYRQMLEYRRMHEREQRRANDLEAQKRVLEASVQAVEICWTQVVNAIRTLTGAQEASDETDPASTAVLTPELDSYGINQALKKRLPATQQLITQFVDMTSKNGVQPGLQEMHTKCSDLQAESSTLRSNTQLLQAEIATLKGSRDSLQRDLLKAQKALDRQRMEHDLAAETWKSRDRDKGSAPPDNASSAPNGSGHATPNGDGAVKDEKPLDVEGLSSLLPDTADIEQKAEARRVALEDLREEHAALQQKYDDLQLATAQPSEEVLRESPFFAMYMKQLATSLNEAADLKTRHEASEKKLDEMRSRNLDFRNSVLAEARTEAEALRQQITQKNGDLVRLRAQRDEMNTELLERRTKESEKLRYAEEVEFLANSRQERIAHLVSEVKRLKGKMSAQAGSEGYLAFLRGEGGIDGDYVKDLEEKLQDATTRLSAVTQDGSDTADIASIRAELEGAKRTLATYERILGPNAEAAEDVKALGQKLQAADAERASLKLQLQEAEESTNALYTEVEGLSKLWEETSQAMSTKVYELKDGELKMSRLATEKAKANNKYFAAMQSKEVIEQESRNVQRTAEKQLILLQKSQEAEKALYAQIAAHEKGLTALKNTSVELQTQLSAAVSARSQLEAKLAQVQTSLTEAQRIMKHRVAEHSTEAATRQKLEEEVEASKRSIKKLKEKQETLLGASKQNASASEIDLEEKYRKLWRILRCSCCHDKPRNQVITRCMHTFCKECLDTRIASRQRKCPACGIAFAKEEVQTLYWQ